MNKKSPSPIVQKGGEGRELCGVLPFRTSGEGCGRKAAGEGEGERGRERECGRKAEMGGEGRGEREGGGRRGKD